jgi:hypothetical protein
MGFLYTFSASSGSMVDYQILNGYGTTSSPAVSNGWVWVQDWGGNLHAFRGLIPVEIEVDPIATSVVVGGLTVLKAVAKDERGIIIPSIDLSWEVVSGNSSIVHMSGNSESVVLSAATVVEECIVQVSTGNLTAEIHIDVVSGDTKAVVVTPSDASVTVASTFQFTATAYDIFGNVVPSAVPVWTSTIGEIDSSGLFTSGTVAGMGTVSATIGSIVGEADVEVLPGTLDRILVTPNSLSVNAGGMASISAIGEDQYGNEITGIIYTWSSTLGTVYPLGGTALAVFQAGTVVGSGSVNVSCGSVSTEIPVSVLPGALDSLVVSPSTAALVVAESRQFTVYGYDVYGNAISGLTVSFTVSAGIGSVNSTGMFTAGMATGIGEVIATSGSHTAEASVTVGHGPLDRIEVSSTSTVTMPAGSAVVLKAIGYDSHGNAVSDSIFAWSADNGSMMSMDGTSEVVYQAGTSVGSRTVTVSNGSVRGSIGLSVVPGPLAVLVVDPAALVVHSGDSVNLTVRGNDAYGNPIPNLEFLWTISSTSSTNDAIGSMTTHADTRTVTLVAGEGATGTLTVASGGKSAVVSVTVIESSSTFTKAAPTIALAAIIAAIALAVLLVLMLLGKLRTVGKKE